MKLLTLLQWFLGAGIACFVAMTGRVAWLGWLALRDWWRLQSEKKRWAMDPVRRLRR